MKAYIHIALVMSPVLFPVLGAEQQIICPTEIPQTSIRLTSALSPWTPYVASPLYLSAASAAAGPPDQLATLMGDSNWKKRRAEWATTYDLSDDSFVAGKWIECRYGEYGQIVLSRQLDSQTKSCKIRSSNGEKAGQRAVEITCQ